MKIKKKDGYMANDAYVSVEKSKAVPMSMEEQMAHDALSQVFKKRHSIQISDEMVEIRFNDIKLKLRWNEKEGFSVQANATAAIQVGAFVSEKGDWR
jgi:ribosomal protein S17